MPIGNFLVHSLKDGNSLFTARHDFFSLDAGALKRIWVSEIGKWVKVKLTARALKTIDKNGAYKVLKEAGVI